MSNEKQPLARTTLTDLTYGNMKKQLKTIYNNALIQSKKSFQIKSGPSYLAETKVRILHSIEIFLTVIGGDSIIITDGVLIIIAIGVPDRVNPVTAIMKQIHQC